jgi:hypothetical protein
MEKGFLSFFSRNIKLLSNPRCVIFVPSVCVGFKMEMRESFIALEVLKPCKFPFKKEKRKFYYLGGKEKSFQKVFVFFLQLLSE